QDCITARKTMKTGWRGPYFLQKKSHIPKAFGQYHQIFPSCMPKAPKKNHESHWASTPNGSRENALV
ncbi:MAG: hypothetical protein SO096_07435, partial [Prevotella sp.]|nr:hypothetical protein [Prevotella sp.]